MSLTEPRTHKAVGQGETHTHTTVLLTTHNSTCFKQGALPGISIHSPPLIFLHLLSLPDCVNKLPWVEFPSWVWLSSLKAVSRTGPQGRFFPFIIFNHSFLQRKTLCDILTQGFQIVVPVLLKSPYHRGYLVQCVSTHLKEHCKQNTFKNVYNTFLTDA